MTRPDTDGVAFVAAALLIVALFTSPIWGLMLIFSLAGTEIAQ